MSTLFISVDCYIWLDACCFRWNYQQNYWNFQNSHMLQQKSHLLRSNRFLHNMCLELGQFRVVYICQTKVVHMITRPNEIANILLNILQVTFIVLFCYRSIKGVLGLPGLSQQNHLKEQLQKVLMRLFSQKSHMSIFLTRNYY